jgi:hypothetical protein
MKLLLTTIPILIFSTKVFSMKPALPLIIKRKVGNFQIVSEPSYLSGKDITKVYKSNLLLDELLWSFDDYTGMKQLFISPDGESLVLFGNVHFESVIKDDDKSAILEIRSKSRETISFTYKDITGNAILADAKKHDISIKGGGWVSKTKLLTLESVDWTNKTIKFEQLKKSW